MKSSYLFLPLLITISFACFVPSSFGQILNIERFRIEKDTSNYWTGNIGLGFSTKKQQNQVTSVNLNSNLVYLSEKHGYLNINYGKLIKTTQQRVISEGYTHWRVNLFRTHRLSYEPFLQLQYDLGRGLQIRELYGASLRFRIKSTPKFSFSINSGGMYEHEIWRGDVLRFESGGDSTKAETYFFKNTTNVSFRGDVSQNVNVFMVTYYQARFTNFFKPRVITDFQVMININKYFSLNNQFVATYDALPLITGNKFVYTYNMSIVVKF
ncbi:MAG: DUF481 domain-containing protein [Sporocytophaga sp.]|uniref:DUF481 domain-containing protein n=1 Tax=Sporocytophaga sp. TaxID=2231183 RepID=UPI001B0E8FDC|nr:DUF481 domain-containing protein [Sporocytophaga sp.]MBO9699242.1 DUF481 domain-containing protein [Sporocytophaga sp.]